MSETFSDQWLAPGSMPLLPKREIGDYVESQGFDVPKRFDTLDDALEVIHTGGTILLRSEHPDEYAGPSGLADSWVISPESLIKEPTRWSDVDIDQEIPLSADRAWISGSMSDGPGAGDLIELILRSSLETPSEKTLERLLRLAAQHKPLQRYADLTKRSIDQLMAESGFSFWEYIPGMNVSVIADDTIDNQYHIFAHKEENRRSVHGWRIANEGGEPIGLSSDNGVLDPDTVRTVIETYEAVRNLPAFASGHCPMMELQIDASGNPWFLQTHRTRDFEAATNQLDLSDFPESQGWQPAELVRGALAEPKTLQMAIWYPKGDGDGKAWNPVALPDHEDASSDKHYDIALSEILSRRRTAFIGNASSQHLYASIAARHDSRSKWFKPEVALTRDDNGFVSLIPRDVFDVMKHRVFRQQRMARVAIDVASDGVQGFIRLNPDSDQPLLTRE